MTDPVQRSGTRLTALIEEMPPHKHHIPAAVSLVISAAALQSLERWTHSSSSTLMNSHKLTAAVDRMNDFSFFSSKFPLQEGDHV